MPLRTSSVAARLHHNQSSTLKDNISMDRRKTLKCLGAAALGLSLPSVSFQSTARVPMLETVPEKADNSPPVTPAVACRVIGVGGAGCNILVSAWSSELLHTVEFRSQFACVSMERQSVLATRKANRLRRGIDPIRQLQLGRFGAHGNVEIARAAARRHDSSLRSLVAGADVVILVAGIGGGTGSAVAPILARMAEEAGALVLGVIVTPFRWELGRYPNAFAAVKALERHSHYLASLSNQVIGDLLGVDATLDDLTAQQELMGTACIHRLMMDGSLTSRPNRGGVSP